MLTTLNVITDAVMLGIIAYVVYDAVTRYRAATGTTWERLLAVGKGTATILVQRGVYLLAALSELLPSMVSVLGAPEVATQIQAVLPPGSGPFFMLVTAALTEWARHRTLPAGS
jgi:hypothetical protein